LNQAIYLNLPVISRKSVEKAQFYYLESQCTPIKSPSTTSRMSSELPTSTRQWILTKKPSSGLPTLSGSDQTFTLRSTSLPQSLQENQLLLKLLYLSNDPAQRGWINPNIKPDRMYLPPVQLNTSMHARGLAEVLDSKSGSFKKGDIVTASVGWSEYAVMDAKMCQPAPELPGGLSRTQYLGAMGMTGLTAYYGVKEVGETKEGDVVVVSGAAGATGSMAVQIAKKIVGAKRVVGIAGSDEKCRWVEELGADKCVNYKKESFRKDLVEAMGGEKSYADVYFDNVGGEILDLMLTRMAMYGRVVACGAISEYNESRGTMLKNYFEIISMRIQIRGMIVFDYIGKMQEVLGIFRQAIQEGKLEVSDESEHVVAADFEEVPKVWMKLFEGVNTGKLVTKIM
jgi:NADPH-dependent curcumin reductase CurA